EEVKWKGINSATRRGRRQCNVIATSGKSPDHMHPATRYVEHDPVTEDLVKCRDKSIASLGVKSPHLLQVPREMTIDHEVRDDHLIKQGRNRSKEFSVARKAIELGQGHNKIAQA